jgi:hypothetical protein
MMAGDEPEIFPFRMNLGAGLRGGKACRNEIPGWRELVLS